MDPVCCAACVASQKVDHGWSSVISLPGTGGPWFGLRFEPLVLMGNAGQLTSQGVHGPVARVPERRGRCARPKKALGDWRLHLFIARLTVWFSFVPRLPFSTSQKFKVFVLLLLCFILFLYLWIGVLSPSIP